MPRILHEQLTAPYYHSPEGRTQSARFSALRSRGKEYRSSLKKKYQASPEALPALLLQEPQ
jgi:hypothetical protein